VALWRSQGAGGGAGEACSERVLFGALCLACLSEEDMPLGRGALATTSNSGR
jgi:hypothetical protein